VGGFADFSEIGANEFCRNVGIMTYSGKAGIVLQQSKNPKTVLTMKLGHR
jgi:hypothetical protein